MRLGDVIHGYRQTHDLSMGEFAKISGLSKPYISKLEANKNSHGTPIEPSIDTLLKAAKAMNISLQDLMYMLNNEQYINFAQPTLNEKQTELIRGYDDLTDDGQNMLLSYLSFLQQSHSKLKVAR